MPDTSIASSAANIDPFKVLKAYEHLRVVDVCDGLDGIGYFNIGLVSQNIRPLWAGMKFWGVAFTLRCVPANRPMWKLSTTDEVVRAHGIWFDEVGSAARQIAPHIRPGHVVVTDVGSTPDCGYWGSENSLSMVERGAVGIVTNGQCRDTEELAIQRTPICSNGRSRVIIPGRIQAIENQSVVGIGGAQVRPGDIIGCDDDGLVVVPIEVAKQVALHARAILLHDMRSRRGHYERLGTPMDSTVDVEAMERHFVGLDKELATA
jgi:4-hydroxy-4-methyl-2-oxoglutarate aldolase